ncbi:hypothetical protein CVS47_01830 [Microbacterium lemovicicum]|uniref:Uncharacterized protein n=1 Tax=Microbacterium lemovicicum TaxID=1072463 RepID=A0A3Q9J1C5_9MICO|nr:hypothetical protein [Microbacterium lemovicicum]AZS37198.1 hypothetical protein CVS47_01830 [Microbacterium lemovicicum]
MSVRLSAPARIWRSRHARTRGDQAYLAYLTLMVTLVTVVPLGRAVSLAASSPQGVALLTAPDASSAVAAVVASLWASFLLLGRVRGPALRPPFQTHALASSDLLRFTSFRGPFLRSAALVVASTAAVGVLIGTSLITVGRSAPGDALLFVLACVCVGIVSAVAWLAGQAMPRSSALLAPLVVGLGAITAAVPAWRFVTPWGWAGLAYPLAASTGALVPLLAVTAAAVSLVPALMSRLSLPRLIAQAIRWEAATSHATGMELATATSVYQPVPTLGRRLRVVRPGLPRPLLFLVRDALGAARTPVRLVAAALAMATAAALFTLSLVGESPGWFLSSAAGVLLFAGLGPFTDGVRHAARAASDLPLYGIGDERLLLHHTLLPVLVTVIMVVVAATISALLLAAGLHALPAIAGSVMLGMLAIVARIATAVKGPLPSALLTPIPTPMGDLGAAARLVWATDGILLAACAGAAAAGMSVSPLPVIAVGAALAGLAVHRWRHRL